MIYLNINNISTFDINKLLGVYIEDGLFFIADTSDLAQPFSDGFVTFHISKDGFAGSNVVPYMPVQFFNGSISSKLRFHQIWFKNKKPINCNIQGEGDCVQCCNKNQNYYNIIGSSEMTGYLGMTYYQSDISYDFIKRIEDSTGWYCSQSGVNCDGGEAGRYGRHVASHEIAHQFNINNSTPCIDGHCLSNAWCGGEGGSCRSVCGGGSDEWCMMNGTTSPEIQVICQRVDGIDKMGCRDLSASGGCTEPDCTGSNQISIRTDYDPE